MAKTSNAETDPAKVVSLDSRREDQESKATAYGGGDGGGGEKVDAETQRYVDKSMDSVKAQNDARFADVMATLRSIQENTISWKGVWGAAGATTVAVAGVVLAALAIGGDRFDGGMAAGVVLEESRQNAERITKMIEAAEIRDGQINAIVTAIEAQNAKSENSPSKGQD